MPAAARVGDPITHTNALAGLVAGVVIGAVVGAVIVGTGGAAAPLLLASAVAGGASLGGTVGEFLGGFSTSTVGKLVEGSPNVRVNSRRAAFCTSPASCSRDSGPQTVAQGSATVFVNRRYAARTGDRGSCGFAVGPGSGNVSIGGGTAACGPVGSEVPGWAHAALFVLGLAGGGLGLAARGLGAAAIAARLGGSVVGGATFGAGGHWLGGAVFGEGSWQQKVLTVGGTVLGGGLGYGVGSRSFPSPATIAQRRATAIDFYRSQGFDDARIASHIRGIDFTRPVRVVPIKVGTPLTQWQVPGAPQGTYYARSGVSPTRLGINPQAQLRGTTTVVEKVANPYVATRDVQALRSRAAPILDDWSVPSAPFQTRGGGVQLFTTNSSAFKPLGP